ncbi:MAG: hypothetical protein ACE5K4_05835 [Candidatus Hydrothermarchaeota archaeon]
MKFECKICNHEFSVSEGAFILICDSCLRCPECASNKLVRKPEERLQGIRLGSLRNFFKIRSEKI